MPRHTRVLAALLAAVLVLPGCATATTGSAPDVPVTQESQGLEGTPSDLLAVSYDYEEVPLERAGVSLHLARLQKAGAMPERDILLVHGVTYSSAEFDLDYQDYSLARFLARGGYAVWTLDIAGYGRSQEVEDGFMPDTAYAAEDVNAAVERICEVSGRDEVDVLGWSWGTMTTSLYAKNHPEHLGRLVLYAPILTGIGEADVDEPFHTNSWEHAASDFQTLEDGSFDLDVTDPVIIEMFCSACWHYDGAHSPNGGRRDASVPADVRLIDLDAITVPTLVIHGDADPYLDHELLESVLEVLPEGSAHVVIPGAAHAAMVEKPYHGEFQRSLIEFLDS